MPLQHWAMPKRHSSLLAKQANMSYAKKGTCLRTAFCFKRLHRVFRIESQPIARVFQPHAPEGVQHKPCVGQCRYRQAFSRDLAKTLQAACAEEMELGSCLDAFHRRGLDPFQDARDYLRPAAVAICSTSRDSRRSSQAAGPPQACLTLFKLA